MICRNGFKEPRLLSPGSRALSDGPPKVRNGLLRLHTILQNEPTNDPRYLIYIMLCYSLFTRLTPKRFECKCVTCSFHEEKERGFAYFTSRAMRQEENAVVFINHGIGSVCLQLHNIVPELSNKFSSFSSQYNREIQTKTKGKWKFHI